MRPRLSCFFFLLLGLCALSAASRAAERIPPPPARYFNDYAQVMPRATGDQLNRRLEQFERDTSNQILVAIFRRMETDSSIEDYTVRIAQSWGAGQKKVSNGAILFVFAEDRQLRIEVGYGLEGALPDALCHQIIQNEITPRFRAGDYAGGLSAGVEAMMAATRGEYKGTGRTRTDARGTQSFDGRGLVFFILFLLIFGARAFRQRGRMLHNPRRWGGGLVRTHGSWGTGFGGGGFGGGGGGGFSGGGGGFGGGGAGGRW